jgi:outer membrane murein-binding lipoprotein Lpp
MRTKLTLIAVITMSLLVQGCRSNKANEKQNADATQQTATPAPPNETAPPPAPDNNAAQPAPAPKKKSAPPSEATPLSRQEATPAAEASATPTPTPTPAPTPIVIAAGTTISIRTTNAISTKDTQTKQDFQASLSRPLFVGSQVVIPKGAPAAGAIPTAESAGRIKGEGTLKLVLTTLTVNGKAYQVSAEPVVIKAKGRGKRSAAMIGGGGGAGALIGGLAGGGKGAAIGAMAGAAAGTAGATMTGKRDVELPAESIVSFRLSKPLVLPPPQGGPAKEQSPELQERSHEPAPSQSAEPKGSPPPR